MTRTRGPGNGIPNKPTNDVLKGELGTSRTDETEGPKIERRTDGYGTANLHYEELPPVRERHASSDLAYWTMERILAALGGVIAVVAVVAFFIRMDFNISDIKSDVKEEKEKLGKLDEKSNRQTAAIEIVAGAVQRLENEVRRTQDYVHDKNK